MSLLGERLRQVREARGISPLQVEIETRIRANVIQALEEGDFASLPPEPFLRGLIRSYSNYLGVDSQEILDLYAADFTPPTSLKPLVDVGGTPSVPLTAPARQPPPKNTPAAPPPSSLPEPIKPTAPIPTPRNEAITPPPMPIAQPAPSLTSIPSMPLPPAPPESLAPPEKLARVTASDATDTAPTFLAHITRRGVPFPVVVLVGIAIILSCIAGTLVFFTKVAPAFVSLAGSGTPTPTHALATQTPTLQPGAPPTPVPTLAVTAAPFATFPGNPTATRAAAPRQTPADTTGMELDVDVTQTITISVGIDGVLVFSGTLLPGTTRSWSAQDTLYVRVENPKGATLSLNGNSKLFGARNYAELNVLERMWTVNDKGTPVSVPPVAPASTPVATPPAIPSPTLTPFS